METSTLPEHYAHIGTDPGGTHFAFCRCGWTGRRHGRMAPSYLPAMDRDQHLKEATSAAGSGPREESS